jgi:predicted double-glycine peptidase
MMAAAAAAAAAALGFPARAADLQISQGGTVFTVPTRTFVDMHFQDVVRQQFDLSCGAAAMATLLKYFYGTDVAEREIIESMIHIGNPEEISKRGFSMLELKHFAEQRGFVSEGFRIKDVSKLAELKVPVLTLVSIRGYKHFVVLKKVHNGVVIIADPAFGNEAKSLSEFEAMWNNVILVVLSKKLEGETHFVQDFAVKARPSEVSLLLGRGMMGVTGGAGEF